MMNVWTRLWFAGLVIFDRLLGTHLVEQELAHLEHRIDAFEAQAAAIRSQVDELNRLLHASQVEFCVLYLRQRHLTSPETWLRFTPSGSAEQERNLDMIIDQLVGHGMATVHAEAMGEQDYVYYLRPDWNAMVDLLHTRKGIP